MSIEYIRLSSGVLFRKLPACLEVIATENNRLAFLKNVLSRNKLHQRGIKFVLSLFANVYKKWVIEKPLASLILVLLVVGYFSYHIPNFKLDASAESLVLENDDSLQYYRTISKSYGSDDFLIITYAPFKDLMSDAVLSTSTAHSNSGLHQLGGAISASPSKVHPK